MCRSRLWKEKCKQVCNLGNESNDPRTVASKVVHTKNIDKLNLRVVRLLENINRCRLVQGNETIHDEPLALAESRRRFQRYSLMNWSLRTQFYKSHEFNLWKTNQNLRRHRKQFVNSCFKSRFGALPGAWGRPRFAPRSDLRETNTQTKQNKYGEDQSLQALSKRKTGISQVIAFFGQLIAVSVI